MLSRILEPEVMDSPDDAQEYDAMDHSTVNAQFVTDLLATITDWSLQRPVTPAAPSQPTRILDLGAGTAQIPIELALRAPHVHITAVDAAESMLALARSNIAAANLTTRITALQADAKCLAATRIGARPHAPHSNPTPFTNNAYDIVISNNILHHIPDPQTVVAEAIRVTTPGGLLFHRDLARPNDEVTLQQLVTTYAADSTPYHRNLFAESLHAALTAEEMASLVSTFGFARDTVRLTSDRHWTWVSRMSEIAS